MAIRRPGSSNWPSARPCPRGRDRNDRSGSREPLLHTASRRTANREAARSDHLGDARYSGSSICAAQSGRFFIPPYVIYEDMLAAEVGWMKRADVNVTSTRKSTQPSTGSSQERVTSLCIPLWRRRRWAPEARNRHRGEQSLSKLPRLAVVFGESPASRAWCRHRDLR